MKRKEKKQDLNAASEYMYDREGLSSRILKVYIDIGMWRINRH